MTRGTEIKFLGKMWFMIILKVTKEQAFNLCSEDTFLRKLQRWGSNGHHPPLPAVLGLTNLNIGVAFLLLHLLDIYSN